MTNPINYQAQQFPAYSGVTINISNPTVNAGNTPYCTQVPIQPVYPQQELLGVQQTAPQQNTPMIEVPQVNSIPNQTQNQAQNQPQQQSYPPQYYLNNYNYLQNGSETKQVKSLPQLNNNNNNVEQEQEQEQDENMDSSNEIISDLESRQAEQQKLEKNGKQKRVVALTNEYIMSLENYLNNPNSEIRIMASKEILKRLDEDKERYDDAALNALLNKMLQDPNKLVRIAALSAFSSQLASGNDYTVELLTNIQQNPDSDKEDVIEAANILLKMSSSTEVKYTPNNNNNEQNPEETTQN